MGASEAGNASVCPFPSRSRSAAYAWATNRDVPHPIAATRMLGAGRDPRIEASRLAACRQQEGWLAISRSISLTSGDYRAESLIGATRARYARVVRQSDRLGAILEELSAGGSVAVSNLSTRLGVSAATIRRDLELLEDQRLLSRTHGGAVAQGVLYELPLRYKAARHEDEKRRIALAAAARAPDGAAIGLTGGTTTTLVARALVERDCVDIGGREDGRGQDPTFQPHGQGTAVGH